MKIVPKDQWEQAGNLLAGGPSALAKACETFFARMPGVQMERAVYAGTMIAASIGLDTDGIVFTDIEIYNRHVTVACVPGARWRLATDAGKLVRLQAATSRLGQRVVVIPEDWVLRSSHPGDTVVAGGAPVSVPTHVRACVLAYLIRHPDAALSEIAALVPGEDPVSTILGLAVSGLVDIDFDREITCCTSVTLARPPA